VNRENRGAFLKSFGRAVDRAFAFRVENERQALPQAEGAGSHGWNQICVGIEDDNLNRPSQLAH